MVESKNESITSRSEVELMVKVCERWERYYYANEERPVPLDRLTRMMDLEKVHAVSPLDLAALLDAPLGDFLHDVTGIHSHMNRSTGELGDCFSPRYTV